MTGQRLTPAQRRALEWLEGAGKATPSSAKRAGHRERVMEALVERGLATVEHRSYVMGSFPLWRPVEPGE